MAKNGNGNGKKLDLPALENWLWEAACVIRGPLDAPKYKDYILPLVFLKRLSDVFDEEIGHLAKEFGGEETALKLVQQDHKLVRFFLPKKARWPTIAQKTTGLGEHLTDAMRSVARENPQLQGVIDVTDYNATTAGQRIVDDGRLAGSGSGLNNPNYRLGLHDVEPDILGRAYEYLLRKFAEGQGQSAGEFYTPREVAVVMARMLDPKPGSTVYDPCCGSGGLLIKCHLRLLEKKGKRQNGRLTAAEQCRSAETVRSGNQRLDLRHRPHELVSSTTWKPRSCWATRCTARPSPWAMAVCGSSIWWWPIRCGTRSSRPATTKTILTSVSAGARRRHRVPTGVGCSTCLAGLGQAVAWRWCWTRGP